MQPGTAERRSPVFAYPATDAARGVVVAPAAGLDECCGARSDISGTDPHPEAGGGRRSGEALECEKAGCGFVRCFPRHRMQWDGSSRILTLGVIPTRVREWRSAHFRAEWIGFGNGFGKSGRHRVEVAHGVPAHRGRFRGGYTGRAIVVPVQSTTRREGDPPFQGRSSPCIFVLARGGTEQPNKAGPEAAGDQRQTLESVGAVRKLIRGSS